MSATVSSDSVAQDQIRAFVERIERLEEERKSIAGDIAEVYAEAKGNGFDRKALKTVVRIRAMDHNDRMEHEALVDLYLSALGMASAPADEEHDEPSFARARAPARAHVETIEEFPVAKRAETEPDAALRPQTGGRETPVDPTKHLTAPRPRIEDAEPQHSGEEAVDPVLTAGEHGEFEPETADDDRSCVSVPGGLANGLQQQATREGGAARPLPSTTSEPAPAILPSLDGAGAVAASRSAVTPPVAPAAPETRRPGETWMERTPPVPARRHDFGRAFPEHWGMALADIKDSVKAEGVREPIIKIGDAILDGWARYTISRELLISYPVKEYDGSDPLLDVIRWNLEARRMPTNERKLVATKLIKLCPDRGEEITSAFGLDHGRAAAE